MTQTPASTAPDLPDLSGKVCLITGVTQGIGRATALALGRLGPTMVLIARDAARGQAVAAELTAQGNPRVELLVGDLSSLADIRRLAAEFRSRHDRLHILINNAGAIFTRRELSVDGIEKTWALNHLAYFLLTDLLLDGIKASAPARIVNVASRAHQRAVLDFTDLQSENGYSGMRAYEQSKLANILFTRELARRLGESGVSGVTVNSLHPGVVATGWGRNTPGLFRRAIQLIAPLMRTPEQGAKTSLYLATSPAVAQVSGAYFADCKEIRPSRAARDPELARRLWEVTVKQIEACAGSRQGG